MNLYHRWYCRSRGWGLIVRERMMPWVLDGVDLGAHPLEIGPGPGLTTDWLRERLPALTSIEIDRDLAGRLTSRLTGSNVTVVQGDATQMTFAGASFTGAVCLTMLHHVPSPEQQDKLFEETCRVLQPGARFAGSDSRPRLSWNLAHLFDTKVPVDPDTVGARLERAGFAEVQVEKNPYAFKFRARKP